MGLHVNPLPRIDCGPKRPYEIVAEALEQAEAAIAVLQSQARQCELTASWARDILLVIAAVAGGQDPAPPWPDPVPPPQPPDPEPCPPAPPGPQRPARQPPAARRPTPPAPVRRRPRPRKK